MGRRHVAILGACLIILGMIVGSTAHSMNVFIGEHNKPGRAEQGLMDLHRWHGHSRRWSRYQRAYSSRCDLRTRTNPKARNLRCISHLHNRALLPVRPMGATDRCTRGLEVLWCTMRCLGCRWTHPNYPLLLSTTPSQLARLVENGCRQADRFRGRFSQHFRHVIIHGRATMGRLPGKLSLKIKEEGNGWI